MRDARLDLSGLLLSYHNHICAVSILDSICVSTRVYPRVSVFDLNAAQPQVASEIPVQAPKPLSAKTSSPAAYASVSAASEAPIGRPSNATTNRTASTTIVAGGTSMGVELRPSNHDKVTDSSCWVTLDPWIVLRCHMPPASFGSTHANALLHSHASSIAAHSYKSSHRSIWLPPSCQVHCIAYVPSAVEAFMSETICIWWSVGSMLEFYSQAGQSTTAFRIEKPSLLVTSLAIDMDGNVWTGHAKVGGTADKE